MPELFTEPFVLGTSHVVAESGVRERLHLPHDTVESAAAELVERGILTEALPLSTCGRLELYATGRSPERAADTVRRLLSRRKGLSGHLVAAHTFHYRADAAVRHAFRVAAGLDSVVHGEAQILGQVRHALQRAREASVTGPVTERLFQRALATGKRVRSETDIGRGTASLVGAALAMVRAHAGSIEGASALVIGAGETGALVARLLSKGGVSSLVVANRTVVRARTVAGALGGRGVDLERLPDFVADADIIVGALAGVEGILRPEHFASMSADRVRYLVDLSHPRAFDPALTELDGIHLVDLDRVAREVDQARSKRLKKVPEAEAIVEAEVASFGAWLRSRHAVLVLRDLRERVLGRAREEAERLARGQSPEARAEAHRLARAVARSLLHGPTVALRQADSSTEEGRRLLDAAAALFDVPPPRDGAT